MPSLMSRVGSVLAWVVSGHRNDPCPTLRFLCVQALLAGIMSCAGFGV